MTEQGFAQGYLLDDKYRIERLLGRGGMGAVYRATHLGTKRAVAVKVIHPQYSNHEEFIARFRREAEAAGRLRHPNVVDVTDFGFAQTDSGQVAYLVMEYLDGCTLAEVLDEEKRLPPAWAVDILEQTCSAVDEAHRLGIVHRDLKPDNIWIEPNRRGGYTVKVLDFGLVKLGDAEPPANEALPDAQTENAYSGPTDDSSILESDTLIQTPVDERADTLLKTSDDQSSIKTLNAGKTPAFRQDSKARARTNPITDTNSAVDTAELTRLGSVMGTPLYMSPEQCKGERLDAKSDIYSLGVIAYRMLAGETPFTGSISELIELHQTNESPPIRDKNKKIRRKTARIVMSALAKDKSQRPDNAAGFASALRASLEGSGTLLSQAVSLYSEHFAVFLKLSLLAYAPLIVVVGLMHPVWWENIGQGMASLIAIPLLLGMAVTNLLAYFTITALTVPLVIQMMIAPLRQVSIKTAFAMLRRRWWVFSAASLAVLVMILFGALFLVLPGAVAAVCYVLYSPVVVMENLGVRATLKRARHLMQRSWVTVIIITILQFTLPILVWIASVDSDISLELADDYSPKSFSFYINISGNSIFYQLLDIFVTPLTAIMTALLYLKTRQAGGESLKDASERFETLELPRSRWQARMRSRSASLTSGTQSKGNE